MEIRLAKTAGFCFGVNRAVELTYNLLNEGHKVATLGPLIHNPQAVADMERRGALVADTVDDIPPGTRSSSAATACPAPSMILWSSAALFTTMPPAPL